MVLVFDKNINVATGNSLYYGNTLLTISQFTASDNIVYRRILLPDTKLLTNSLELSYNGVALTEFEDYSIFINADMATEITLKNNNNLPGNLTTVHLEYKSDRTIEQLYYDALEVSKRSAFLMPNIKLSLYIYKKL